MLDKKLLVLKDKSKKLRDLAKENKEVVVAGSVAVGAGTSVLGVGGMGVAALGTAFGVTPVIAAPALAILAGLSAWGAIDVYKKSRNKRRVPEYHTIKKEMFDACGGVCRGCGKKKYYEDFEVDHIKPLSKGGSNDKGNLQLLCGHCNRKKSNKTDF